jgi:hypothetical protein
MDGGINNMAERQLTGDYSVQNNLSEELKETKDKEDEKKDSVLTDSDSDDPADSYVSGEASGKDENAVDEKELTVLYYLNGSEDFMSESIVGQIIDLEGVGSTDDINLVAQLNRKEDRETEPEDRLDGGWTGSRRYNIIKSEDADSEKIPVDEVLEVLEKHPENPDCLKLISTIYNIKGNDEKAWEYYNKSEEIEEQRRNTPPEEDFSLEDLFKKRDKYKSDLKEKFGNDRDSQLRLQGFERVGETEISSPVVEELPEIKEGEGAQALQDFLEWGIENNPAKNYILVASAHGHPVKGLSEISSIPEMNKAITEGVKNANEKSGRNDSINVLALQTCNVGNLEAMYELKDSADTIITTQYMTASSVTYKWDDIISQVQENIDKRGNFEVKQFVKDIVDYFRIEDEDEPGKLMPKGYTTLSAVDTEKIPDLMKSFNDFLETCDKEKVSDEQLFRAVAKSDNLFYLKDSLSYIQDVMVLKDFGTFLHNMKESEDSPESVKDAADNVLQKLEETVIEQQSVNGFKSMDEELRNATGLSFVAPDNAVDTLAQLNSRKYMESLPNFVETSIWDDRLKETAEKIPEDLRNEAYDKCVKSSIIKRTGLENLTEEQKALMDENPLFFRTAEDLKDQTYFYDREAFREEQEAEKIENSDEEK